MKKYIFGLLLFLAACSKTNQTKTADYKGTLGLYNEASAITVDSLTVNGMLYQSNLNRAKMVFPVIPVSGEVKVYLSGSAGIIVFKGSDSRKISMAVSAGHFVTSAVMDLSGKGVVATVTITDN